MKKRFSLALGGRMVYVAYGVVIAFVLIAIFAPFIAPYPMDDTSGDVWEAVSLQHVFGTDGIGRDILSRMIYGARVTFVVAGTATLMSFALGVLFGFTAGVAGGRVDQVLSRAVDFVMSIPTLIFALLVLAIVPINWFTLIAVMASLDSTRVFRLARSLSAGISVLDYIEVARLRGESFAWIIAHEILPNALAPLIAEFALRFGFAILFLSSLSFLGLGVQPPEADWGSLVRENKDGIIFGVPAALIPGFAIAILSISVNSIADRLIGRSARLRRNIGHA